MAKPTRETGSAAELRSAALHRRVTQRAVRLRDWPLGRFAVLSLALAGALQFVGHLGLRLGVLGSGGLQVFTLLAILTIGLSTLYALQRVYRVRRIVGTILLAVTLLLVAQGLGTSAFLPGLRAVPWLAQDSLGRFFVEETCFILGVALLVFAFYLCLFEAERVQGLLEAETEELRDAHAQTEAQVQERTANLRAANVRLEREIAERRAAEKALRRRDTILEAVSFAAGRFLRDPDWRNNIDEVLQRLAKAAETSRAYVFERHLAEDGTPLASQRFEWTAPGISPQISDPQFQNVPYLRLGLDDWDAVLSAGESLQGHVREFPPNKQAFVRQESGVKSILVVPVFVSNASWGCIGFDACLEEREWTLSEIDAIKAAAGTLGAAIERERFESMLRMMEQRFVEVLDHSRDVLYRRDLKTDSYDYLGAAAGSLLGYAVTKKEMFDAEAVEAFLHPDDREPLKSHMAAIRTSGPGDESIFTREYRVQRSDGSYAWLSDNHVVLRDPDGRPTHTIGSVRDITELKEAEERVQESLREKEVLLKEIHHRVKNNLQVIWSLLDLQAETIKDPQALSAFRNSQNHLRVMAIIHEKLYRAPDLTRIDVAEYLNSVLESLIDAHRTSTREISIGAQVDDVHLGIDTAIPCGLIVSELVSNALKYAFPEDRVPLDHKSQIRVELATQGDGICQLSIADNGVGLPAGLDFHSVSSFGLELVDMLTRQLKGAVSLDCTEGTVFRIRFPLPPSPKG